MSERERERRPLIREATPGGEEKELFDAMRALNTPITNLMVSVKEARKKEIDADILAAENELAELEKYQIILRKEHGKLKERRRPGGQAYAAPDVEAAEVAKALRKAKAYMTMDGGRPRTRSHRRTRRRTRSHRRTRKSKRKRKSKRVRGRRRTVGRKKKRRSRKR